MPILQPSVFWLYGLSGAGKSTLTNHLHSLLQERGIYVLKLDGDEFRNGLSKDLGFSPRERMENIRRAAEVAKLASLQGLVVLAAFMTPEREMRDLARSIISPVRFFEIYLHCDVETCERRDGKGIYAKALSNTITNLPGKDLKFDVPESPDLVVNTERLNILESQMMVRTFVADKIGAVL